jgi:SAM-dependent methyltransferase
MLISRMITGLMGIPGLWDLVQDTLGAPRFKRELYLSKLHPPGRLLDFGCANGHLADAFRAFEYHGVDLDPSAIAAARRHHEGRPNVHFLAADLRTRPFPEDYFDEILFACTAHHLDDETMRGLLDELHHCLKPGGVIHLFDPVFREPVRWSHRLMRWLDQGKYPRTTEQMLGVIEPLGLFRCGQPSYYPPRGALLQDCDFLHLPLAKAAADAMVSDREDLGRPGEFADHNAHQTRAANVS